MKERQRVKLCGKQEETNQKGMKDADLGTMMEHIHRKAVKGKKEAGKKRYSKEHRKERLIEGRNEGNNRRKERKVRER